MAQCLITKLNTIVDNDLPIIGSMKIHVTNNKDNDVRLQFSNYPVTIKYSHTGQIMTITNPIIIDKGEYDMTVISKYDSYPIIEITSIFRNVFTVNAKDLKYYNSTASNEKRFYFCGGDVHNYGIIGNIDDLFYSEKIDDVRFVACHNIYGNGEQLLNHFPNIKYINNENCENLLITYEMLSVNASIFEGYQGTVSGDILHYVNAARAKGVYERFIKANYIFRGNGTVGDETPPYNQSLPYGAISWTANTVMIYQSNIPIKTADEGIPYIIATYNV